MTVNELGETLGRMYRQAPKGEAVAMIHLFGIKHAEAIRACDGSIADIVRAAGISDSYVVEVNKGVNLAKYVSIRA